MMNVVRIGVLSIVAAMLYGIALDQVCARICIEYFTIGHRAILDHTHVPTLLGLAWGVLLTWRAGLGIGVALAIVSRAGRMNRKIGWFELIKPVAVVLAVTAIGAFISGAVAYKQAVRGIIGLQGDLAWQVPFEAQNRFVGCEAAHLASYALGFLGGLVLCGYVFIIRLRAPRAR